jgi:hypothetical protein
MRPLCSSGAMRSPAYLPNDAGATSMPPSSRGACGAIVLTPPAQSSANSAVPFDTAAVTRSR